MGVAISLQMAEREVTAPDATKVTTRKANLRPTIEVIVLILLAVITWSLFSLPAVFYLGQLSGSVDKVPFSLYLRVFCLCLYACMFLYACINVRMSA